MYDVVCAGSCARGEGKKCGVRAAKIDRRGVGTQGHELSSHPRRASRARRRRSLRIDRIPRHGRFSLGLRSNVKGGSTRQLAARICRKARSRRIAHRADSGHWCQPVRTTGFDPSRPLSLRARSGPSCPKPAIQRSIEDQVRQVSKLPFVAPPFSHWSVGGDAAPRPNAIAGPDRR